MPSFFLAWQVLSAADGSPAVLNAANEVAVAAFLDRRLRFVDIHRVNHETLAAVAVSDAHSVEGLLNLDGQARRVALQIVNDLGGR